MTVRKDAAISESTLPDGPRVEDAAVRGPGAFPAWIGWAVGLLGAVVSVITAALSLGASVGPAYVVTLYVVTVMSFTLILVYLLRRLSLSISRLVGSQEQVQRQLDTVRSQVSEIQLGHRVVSSTLELARDLNQEVSELRTAPEPKDVAVFTRNIVRNMARVFSESLGEQCRVCVKQVKNDDKNEPWVEAIARSDRSVDGDIGKKHYISQNTDFDALRVRKQIVWFCEDIQTYPFYQTTSKNPTYRSTIVWPIITRIAAEEAPGPEFAPIVAYLCIDSNRVGAFDYENHVPVGWVVCDALARLYEAQRSIWISE